MWRGLWQDLRDSKQAVDGFSCAKEWTVYPQGMAESQQAVLSPTGADASKVELDKEQPDKEQIDDDRGQADDHTG
jgi:hypothetical protein